MSTCAFPAAPLDWGNRDYDVNLLLADKAWDETGQLWFNIVQHRRLHRATS